MGHLAWRVFVIQSAGLSMHFLDSFLFQSAFLFAFGRVVRKGNSQARAG